MANPKHVKMLRRGAEKWNRWHPAEFDSVDFSGFDIRGANFAKAELAGVELRGADLRGADLSEANLSGAVLNGVNLTDANLLGADLGGADLGAAYLDNANLVDVRLIGANLSGANLRGANLESAETGYTIFADCDLSEVRGLETVRHFGPSTIGLDTVYKSRGKIPESFLRGCGVPESFITQMRSLVNAEDGLQFYSCFLSHSTKDAEFATRLHGKMRDAHLRVWYAPEDMPGGKKLHEEIETQIRMYDKLLIVLSEHSLESEWVKTELRRAFQEERASERAGKKKRKLFPVRLTDMERIKAWSCFDADSGKDLGVELREYFIPDFSHWKEHDQFEASFARLLKDLQADERAR